MEGFSFDGLFPLRSAGSNKINLRPVTLGLASAQPFCQLFSPKKITPNVKRKGEKVKVFYYCRFSHQLRLASNSVATLATSVRFNAHYNYKYVCMHVCVCQCVYLLQSQHFYGLLMPLPVHRGKLQISTKQAHLMTCPPGGVAQSIMSV